MSTYIESEVVEFFVPAHHEPAALAALQEVEVNPGAHQSVAAVVRALGYEVEITSAGTALTHFSGFSRRGIESTALAALAPFVADGSHVVWSIGDGQPWREVVRNGQLVSQHIEWVDDKTEQQQSPVPSEIEIWTATIDGDDSVETLAAGSERAVYDLLRDYCSSYDGEYELVADGDLGDVLYQKGYPVKIDSHPITVAEPPTA